MELTISGVSINAVFRDTSTSESFNFPLAGSDFSTERTGTLWLAVTESLTAQVTRASFVAQLPIPGVCGYGVCGFIQGANETYLQQVLPCSIRVQTLPIGVQASQGLPYVVTKILPT
jgi:hypothetical protein